MISAINISFKKTIINWSREITSSGSVINITSWGSVAGFQIQALHESLKEKLEKLPNLNPAISTPVTAVRVIPINILGERYMIKAYDNPGTSEYYKFIVPITGDRDEMAKKLYNEDEQNILVSEQFLKRFNKQVGDVFEMETPSGLAQFTMAGLIREFGSPNGVIYFHRKLYKKYWKDDLVSLFSIHHSPEISSADYLAKVGPDLNQKEHLQAEFPSKIAEDVEKNIENNMAMSDSTKWIALIIGTMGLLNSFLIALLQRFRELGCIRSIGMTKAQMIGMVLSECVTLGFTGVLMSFLLTLPVAYCWVNYTLTFLLGWKVDYYFEGSDYALFMGIGLFVSLVAGIFPAMRAARLKLREALEYE